MGRRPKAGGVVLAADHDFTSQAEQAHQSLRLKHYNKKEKKESLRVYVGWRQASILFDTWESVSTSVGQT